MRREQRHAGHQRVGVDAGLHDQPRRGIEHAAVVARDRQRIDGLAVDDRLAARRLRIDERRLPDTVIVSCSEPSRRSALIGMTPEPETLTLSRFTVVNPVSENVTT